MKYPEQCQFHLFGMGSRRKMLFVPGGRLREALTLETVAQWDVVNESLEAFEYRVVIETRQGQRVRIVEDEDGVWVEEKDGREALTRGQPVRLPRFEGHPYAPWLRARQRGRVLAPGSARTRWSNPSVTRDRENGEAIWVEITR